jgi:predicted unusual protein kinase regulating ubiquinone biosynthesis (AarF/ABC1/UbiB family)
MKLGQLLSLQGEGMLPPRLREALAQLQNHAHFMPEAQVRQVLLHEYGRDWKSRFAEFDFEPLAAASIGQVHAATARDGRDLALKLQYPGVERSIDGDVDNLALLLRALRLVPAGLDLEAVVPELKEELRREADYAREARSQEQYRALVGADPGVLVPRVHPDLSTRRVLASDRVRALPIEDLRSPEHPQRRRDEVGAKLLRLVFRELFEFRFVQTDPNFANYLFDDEADCIRLLDLGSAREYPPAFVAHYAALCRAVVAGEREAVRRAAVAIGYLRDDDPPARAQAAIDLMFLVCEPFRRPGVYDFARSTLAGRARDAGFDLAFRKGFLRAPPPETVFLHRKLVGSFLLCARIRARVHVGRILRPLLARA